MSDKQPPAGPYLLDTNVFVAAIRSGERQTVSFRLIARLVGDPMARLVGDPLLVAEYSRYAEIFPSAAAVRVLASLLGRIEVVNPAPRFQRACLAYFKPGEGVDGLHASVCLQTGALVISNDRGFDSIAAAGLIRRLTITEAVRAFL
jgi:predicted nucleic acid-binding protein